MKLLVIAATFLGGAISSIPQGSNRAQGITRSGQQLRAIVVDRPGSQKVSRMPNGIRIPQAPRLQSPIRVKQIAREVRAPESSTTFDKVTLTSKQPYTPNARIDFCDAAVYDSGTGVLIDPVDGNLYEGSFEVSLKAPKAGDYYLVTLYVEVLSDQAKVGIHSSGAPQATLQLAMGSHQIPVVVIANSAGWKYVDLKMQQDKWLYFHRAEIQLLEP